MTRIWRRRQRGIECRAPDADAFHCIECVIWTPGVRGGSGM